MFVYCQVSQIPCDQTYNFSSVPYTLSTVHNTYALCSLWLNMVHFSLCIHFYIIYFSQTLSRLNYFCNLSNIFHIIISDSDCLGPIKYTRPIYTFFLLVCLFLFSILFFSSYCMYTVFSEYFSVYLIFHIV